MTDTTLAPCPFCGSNQTAAPHDTHRPGCYFLVLASVKASPDADVSWATDLIAAWNRRAPAPAPTDAEIDAAYRKVWSTIPHAKRLSAFAHEIATTLAARWGAPAPASDALEKAVRKLHAARGRHHNQIAACDLYDLLGLPNVRPGQEAAPPAQEVRVPLDPQVVGALWLKSQGVCLTFCRLLEAEHGITAAQKETP